MARSEFFVTIKADTLDRLFCISSQARRFMDMAAGDFVGEKEAIGL
jgi:hypothetical protein